MNYRWETFRATARINALLFFLATILLVACSVAFCFYVYEGQKQKALLELELAIGMYVAAAATVSVHFLNRGMQWAREYQLWDKRIIKRSSLAQKQGLS